MPIFAYLCCHETLSCVSFHCRQRSLGRRRHSGRLENIFGARLLWCRRRDGTGSQSTCGVARVRPVGAELVRQQVDAVLADLRPEAVKIGQLPTAAVVRAVGRALRAHPPRWVVLDPVMVSSLGRRLMAPDAVAALCSDLLPLCSLLTPNRAEAAVLAEHVTLPSPSGAGPALLVTGGDAQGAPCDVLLTAAGRQELRGRRVNTRNDHGTGCTLIGRGGLSGPRVRFARRRGARQSLCGKRA